MFISPGNQKRILASQQTFKVDKFDRNLTIDYDPFGSFLVLEGWQRTFKQSGNDD